MYYVLLDEALQKLFTPFEGTNFLGFNFRVCCSPTKVSPHKTSAFTVDGIATMLQRAHFDKVYSAMV